VANDNFLPVLYVSQVSEVMIPGLRSIPNFGEPQCEVVEKHLALRSSFSPSKSRAGPGGGATPSPLTLPPGSMRKILWPSTASRRSCTPSLDRPGLDRRPPLVLIEPLPSLCKGACRPRPGPRPWPPSHTSPSSRPQGQTRRLGLPPPWLICLVRTVLNFSKMLLVSDGRRKVPHSGRGQLSRTAGERPGYLPPTGTFAHHQTGILGQKLPTLVSSF